MGQITMLLPVHSSPREGRELKHGQEPGAVCHPLFAPVQGCELKYAIGPCRKEATAVRHTGGRELKPLRSHSMYPFKTFAPFGGVS